MSTTHSKKQNIYVILGWVFIVLSAIILLYLAIVKDPSDAKEVGMLANWGDWAGGVTAPLLGIAGYFFIYAAFRQQSQDALEGQQRFLQQQFESTFFNLIQLHNQNVSAIQQGFHTDTREPHFFAFGHEYLEKQSGRLGDLQKIKGVYNDDFYPSNYNHIDHFVRHLLFCVRNVDETSAFGKLPEGKPTEIFQHKKRFIDILLAQLSTDELFLLFYHCLCRADVSPATRKQLSRYDFFERLYQDDLLLHADHQAAFMNA